MSRAGLLAAGRRAALAGMSDTIAVYEVGYEVDPITGEQSEVTTTVYLGPGKIQFYDGTFEQVADAAGHSVVTGRSILHLPWDADGLKVNQRAVVAASTYAPNLTERQWRLTNVPEKSQATALRLPIEEVLA